MARSAGQGGGRFLAELITGLHTNKLASEEKENQEKLREARARFLVDLDEKQSEWIAQDLTPSQVSVKYRGLAEKYRLRVGSNFTNFMTTYTKQWEENQKTSREGAKLKAQTGVALEPVRREAEQLADVQILEGMRNIPSTGGPTPARDIIAAGEAEEQRRQATEAQLRGIEEAGLPLQTAEKAAQRVLDPARRDLYSEAVSLASTGDQDKIDKAQQLLIAIGRDPNEAIALAKPAQERARTERDLEEEVAKIARDEETKDSERMAKAKDAEEKAEKEKKKLDQDKIDKLRTRRDALVKSSEDVFAAYDRISAVGREGTPASDLALIFNFMKMLDPGSVVRESEFRTAADAKAWLVKMEQAGVTVPAPVADAIRKATEGTILNPAQREDFLRQASNLRGAAEQTLVRRLDRVVDDALVDEIPIEAALGASLAKRYTDLKQAGKPPGPVNVVPTQEAKAGDTIEVESSERIPVTRMVKGKRQKGLMIDGVIYWRED